MTIITSSHFAERTLTQWLSYLENLHSTEIDLGLTRISQVAERLAISFDFATVITVAGTNGKGTTCAFIENTLVLEQKSVAVYSSPHIEKFNERLRINQVDVEDQYFIQAFEKIEQARGDISLSYYEYTTLAAFIILQQEQPDYIILEVGLGGRLDATNIIDADFAVITTVDLDHQSFLGDTRELIGVEKAGIMRANKPAIIGDLDIPHSVIQYATQIGAQICCREQDFAIEIIAQTSEQEKCWQWSYGLNRTGEKAEGQVEQKMLSPVCFSSLSMPAIPIDNVASALAVLIQLPLSLSRDKVNQVIKQTKVAGRTELFHLANGCNVILDVGHNPQACRYLAGVLVEQNYQQLHAVVGMLADKDIRNSLLPISAIADHWYFGTLPGARAEKSETMAAMLPNKAMLDVNCFDSIKQAYSAACENAQPNDLILVFGSFFTVSEIRAGLI